MRRLRSRRKSALCRASAGQIFGFRLHRLRRSGRVPALPHGRASFGEGQSHRVLRAVPAGRPEGKPIQVSGHRDGCRRGDDRSGCSEFLVENGCPGGWRPGPNVKAPDRFRTRRRSGGYGQGRPECRTESGSCEHARFVEGLINTSSRACVRVPWRRVEEVAPCDEQRRLRWWSCWWS